MRQAVQVRWDALFDDLDAQLDALERAERASELADRTRGELASIGLVDRLRATVGADVRIGCGQGLAVAGTLSAIAPQWALLDEGAGREVLVPLASVTTVRGVGRNAAVPGSAGVVESRLGLRHALRGIARDRLPVRLHLGDATVVDATIDRVGADFVEVATHAAGEARRQRDVRESELIPFTALAAVRRLR